MTTGTCQHLVWWACVLNHGSNWIKHCDTVWCTLICQRVIITLLFNLIVVIQTQEEFKNLYKDALPSGAEGSTHAAYAYDSILALASVLNTTKWLETDSNTSSPINLETIVEELKRARINGVSVRVCERAHTFPGAYTLQWNKIPRQINRFLILFMTSLWFVLRCLLFACQRPSHQIIKETSCTTCT